MRKKDTITPIIITAPITDITEVARPHNPEPFDFNNQDKAELVETVN